MDRTDSLIVVGIIIFLGITLSGILRGSIDWADLPTPFAIFISGLAAILTYRNSIKLRKAIWLAKLYREFYEKEYLKRIRGMLDSPERKALEEAVEKEMKGKKLSKKEEKTLEELTDYLNFFEFILYLHKIKELKKEDIKQMFDYYLKLLKKKPIRKYIGKYGYELINEYLKKHEEQ